MRVVALIFGLLGAAGSGFVGVKWMNDPAIGGKQAELKLAHQMFAGLPPNPLTDEVEEAYRRSQTYYFLLGAAAVAAVACVLVLSGKGLFAAILFLVAFAGPMAMYQKPQLVVFTGALAIAGVFSIFVKPSTPYKAPKPGEDISEDDDMV
jgi:hypothetical protein